MTTAKTPKTQGRFRLPDPPEREPDEVTSYDHLHEPGNSHHLIQHLGNPATTVVGADHWITADPQSFRTLARYPDLFVAFDADRAAYRASNGYIISEQGKPPDFVLEVASASTADVDVGDKRADYAALGIPEYWRFDETGEHHGTRLAGDRLMGGVYVPIDLEERPDGGLQGYSEALNLYLRWEQGQLGWYDPATGRHITTFEDERDARIREQARADTAETRADEERNRADTAEAALNAALERIRQLEDQQREN